VIKLDRASRTLRGGCRILAFLANGVTESPENSDKLAQRNLQITSSGNPSYPLSHRVPQAFDMRPSRDFSRQVGQLLDYPDELMIDWANTPVGSIASIYGRSLT
jgi:hypothetical protein